ncbi:MAG: helix-turn-helix transcriptional regulator [Acidobacteria bacterium]|nr:helix-turn-helix transcriptional regulator [Acidobacteriota bacterium]MYJ05857.1 helix-turn-helix transcriptional regulator [Acidobacteriota bacterium]
MNLHLLYAAIDGAHVAFLVALAIRLLALAPRNRNVQLIALLAFGAICSVVSARHSYMAVLPAAFAVDLGPLIIPMNLARNLTSGLVMVLSHRIFRDGERLPPPLLAVWAVQTSLEEPLEWMATFAWAPAQPHTMFALYEVVPSALQIVMLGFALVWALRDSDADLVEARRKTRVVLVVVSVAHIVLALLVERLALQIWALPSDVYFAVHTCVTVLGLLLSGTIVVLLLRPDAARFVDPLRPAPVAAAAEVSRDEYDVARIRAAFESERVYRRMGLTVGALAEHLKIPEYRLRSLIHKNLGYRNFNTLLHDYRVAEVCEALADPAQDDMPVLTLALTAGYQSITPFNRAFRALKGMTPTQFRARSRQKPADC